MATYNTDLVMVMRLRDQLSKDLRSAQSNLDKMKKSLDQNNKTTKETNTWWKNATNQLKDFNKALVVLGLSSVAAGFGLKEIANASQNLANVNAETQFSVSLLGPAAQAAYAAMKPSFDKIGASVLATASQVNEAYGIMSEASGKAVLSAKDLQAAFTIAKVTGVSFASAAKLVGEALRGNQDPLRQLVGIYGYKGLADVENNASTAARANWTAMDKLKYQFASVRDSLAKMLTPALTTVLGIFNDIPKPVKEAGIVLVGIVGAIIAVSAAITVLTAAVGGFDLATGGILLIIGAAIAVFLVLKKYCGVLIAGIIAATAAVIGLTVAFFGLDVASGGVILAIGAIILLIMESIKHWQSWGKVVLEVLFPVIGIVEELKKHWSELVGFFKKWGEVLLGLLGPIGLVIDAGLEMHKHWQTIVSWFRKAWDAIKGAWNANWNAIKHRWDDFTKYLTTGWNLVAEPFLKAWDGIRDAWKSIWDELKRIWDDFVGDIKTVWDHTVGPIFDKISSFVDKITGKGGGGVGGTIKSLLNPLNVAKDVGKAAKSFASKLNPFNWQTGGTMPRTGLAIVGEAGPELLTLPGGAKITPAAETKAILGGGMKPVLPPMSEVLNTYNQPAINNIANTKTSSDVFNDYAMSTINNASKAAPNTEIKRTLMEKTVQSLIPSINPLKGLANLTRRATGGLISEPTFTVGLQSGKLGTMAEHAPEAVVPQGREAAGGDIHHHYHITGTVIDQNALDGFVRKIQPRLQQNNRRGWAASPGYGG